MNVVERDSEKCRYPRWERNTHRGDRDWNWLLNRLLLFWFLNSLNLLSIPKTKLNFKTRKRMRSIYICQYKVICKYNVNWKKQGTEAYLVCYHLCEKACALKRSRKIHLKKKCWPGLPPKGNWKSGMGEPLFTCF